MVQKHLHELLEEDQEPFLLQNYIADQRSRLNIKNTSIVSSTTKQSNTLFKNACLFSFYDSPDPRKSPLLSGFLSPNASSLAKNCSNAVLHIPARTAALLLEAAMRIHKHSVSKKKKTSLGLFDLVFKRLGSRNRDRSPEKSLDLNRCSNSSTSTAGEEEHIPAPATELETSLTFILSPFHFSLNGRHSPEFLSPVTSPAGRRTNEGKNKIDEEESIENDKEREEEEQFSPVSVLEPQFEDDDELIHEDSDNIYEAECSYVIDQSTYDNYFIYVLGLAFTGAKHQLLEKLRRFERLAQLDPYELDKTLFDYDENEEHEDEDNVEWSKKELDEYFLNQVMDKSGVHLDKRLVSDLIVEEEKRGELEEGSCEKESVMKRVCTRLDEWEKAKPESIDMMIELDYRREVNGWWKRSEEIDDKQVKEVATEIQIAILVELIEELSEELLIVC
ncbi:uncharacterized protein LOC124935600 [Impatiens glandulifera]|uniref:uncharacterized protein LOC124935600 n=1 Tax=Impatiens glandulifera TaxID=253017 RepID=UPI001FB06EDF|nr:uncharacterized protein LOC124935600 [Impatiens glandulifera]